LENFLLLDTIFGKDGTKVHLLHFYKETINF